MSTPEMLKNPKNPRQPRFNEIQIDQKRRSSSRSIKRKRFDDEIVEYSLCSQQTRGETNRVGRPRTVSQTFVPPPPIVPLVQATSTPLSQKHPGGPTITANNNISSINVTTPSLAPPQTATPLPLAPLATSHHDRIVTSFSSEKTPQAIGVPPNGLHSKLCVAPPHHLASSYVGHGPLPYLPEKRRYQRAPIRKPRKTGRTIVAFNTKDLGRWKPMDDLALIIGIQQTNDIRVVLRGTKFSCRFTLQELQARWSSLLYEPAISRIAVTAMRNLHPELIQSVQKRALFSVAEEDLLRTIKSTECAKVEQFQELLDANPSVFYMARTAKILHNHWLLMKQYHLLPDQMPKPVGCTDQPITFSDAEEMLVDAELYGQRDETLEIELQLTDRRQKHEIRVLETELNRWNVLVESITGNAITPEFDGQTLAVLRGRYVRYLMRSKEITFGRYARDCNVDVDLSFEGPATKISRRQGTIKLRSNGDFFIANEGTRSLFINGAPLITNTKTRLTHNSVIEISGLRLVFLVNYDLINAIRQESAKTTTALN